MIWRALLGAKELFQSVSERAQYLHGNRADTILRGVGRGGLQLLERYRLCFPSGRRNTWARYSQFMAIRRQSSSQHEEVNVRCPVPLVNYH